MMNSHLSNFSYLTIVITWQSYSALWPTLFLSYFFTFTTSTSLFIIIFSNSMSGVYIRAPTKFIFRLQAHFEATLLTKNFPYLNLNPRLSSLFITLFIYIYAFSFSCFYFILLLSSLSSQAPIGLRTLHDSRLVIIFNIFLNMLYIRFFKLVLVGIYVF